MSFSCEHCGLQNNEIQSGAKIQVNLTSDDFNQKFITSISNPKRLLGKVGYLKESTIITLFNYFQEKGIRFIVSIENARDMSRQVVKSDYATISVPELELEIPPTEKKGGKRQTHFLQRL
jgi:C4-type Zn-finger protein